MKTGVRTVTAILGAVAFIASCGRSTEQAQETGTSTPPAVVTPVVASVVAAPIPVPATDGKDHLAYELQLTNTLTQDVTLTSLAVVAGDQTLMTLSGDNLAYWTRIIGNPSPTTKLGPGQTAVVWLDVVVDETGHRSRETHPRDRDLGAEAAAAAVARDDDRDGRAGHRADPQAGGHRATAGRPELVGRRQLLRYDRAPDGDEPAQRPAVGRRTVRHRLRAARAGRPMFAGDKAKPESYPYFGADIHAVADGKVVAVLDGLPEQVAGRSPTGLPLDQYGGNHIVQDIGDGNYAFYAHLKTGSVKVKPGDQLTTGQVIASLGNTGNSDAPHLHFHVMSTPDPLASDGLPFVFSSFKLNSRMVSLDALDALLTGQPAQLQPGFAARDETDVSPLVLDVMSYATG